MKLRHHSRVSVLPQTRQAPILRQTLQGLGGIGKTQLATEYARRYQGDYELIWWIPAEDARSIRRSFVSLARRMNLPEGQDVQYTVDSVLDELRLGNQYPSWLLIFDGAEDPAELEDYLPSGSGHVLITSRNRGWVNRPNVNVIELDVFTREEALEFLTRRWTGLSGDDASLLAHDLGHLPIALEQAVAVHRETGMQLTQYRSLLARAPGRLLDEGTAGEYPRSVAETWRLAFDELKTRSAASAQLLIVCSCLSSQPIFVPMLTRGRGAPLPEPLAGTLDDEIKLRGAVRELGRFALAKLDVARDFITIHPLVRAVIQADLTPEQQVANRGYAHQLLAHANPGDPDVAGNWTQFSHIAPHVLPSRVMDSTEMYVRRVGWTLRGTTTRLVTTGRARTSPSGPPKTGAPRPREATMKAP